jgi:hypothetical protein
MENSDFLLTTIPMVLVIVATLYWAACGMSIELRPAISSVVMSSNKWTSKRKDASFH